MDVETAKQDMILLVGDDKDRASEMASLLSGFEVTLLVAEDQADAIAQATHLQPDVVILSVLSFGSSAFEVCQALKTHSTTSDIPVLLIIDPDDAAAPAHAVGAGATDWLVYPFRPVEVCARLTTSLSLRGLKRQVKHESTHRQQIEQSMRLLLYAMSHDLRNPVLGMQMVLRNLIQGVGVCAAEAGDVIPVPRSILERMLQGSDRHLNLINALVDVHSGSTKRMTLQRESIQLRDLIPKVLKELEPLLDKNQATLSCEMTAALPLVMADPTQIQRVFEHLITNALKHNPPGIHLTIEAVLEGNVIRCSVQDNGVGIPSEQCHQLFDLYQRGPNARHTYGLGLGLFLCQQIIRAHGGAISVSNRHPSGATFWFTLPLQPENLDDDRPNFMPATATCSGVSRML